MSDEITISESEKGRTAEVKISDKTTVIFRELTGSECRKVEKITGAEDHMLIRNLALYALSSINGEALVPVANEMHFDARTSKFTPGEYFSLARWYDKAFNSSGETPPND